MMKKKSFFMFIISLMILCFLFVGVSAEEYECYENEDCGSVAYDCISEDTLLTNTPVCVDNVCDVEQTQEVCDDDNACTEDTCVDTSCVFEVTSASDTEGPITSNIDVDPIFNNGIFNLSAIATDECSAIKTATYYLGYTETAHCGNPIIGISGTIYPENDGSFDLDNLQEILKFVSLVYNVDGFNWACIQSEDSLDNLGNCECISYQSDTIVPEEPINVKINEIVDPYELLVCGEDPTLTAEIWDSQSPIQGGEYFMNMEIPPYPDGFTGEWMEVIKNWQEDQWHKGIIQAVIDLDYAIEGTNYIKLRGKDNKENWGKMLDYYISFIKDTTPPKTEKILNAEVKVDCTGDEYTLPEGIEGLTNGCAYVKTGTTITLDANDFNPDDDTNGGYNDNPGQYAHLENTYYKIWYSYDCNTNWEVIEEGIYDGTPITLTQDSCHLIEYWSKDLCGWEETHHFELDIVDTQAPIVTKEIIGPQYYDEQEEKLYLDGRTLINLTCVDQEPHPVNDVTIYYRYFLDGQLIQDWIEYQGPFGFPEESQHRLEYYCVDALGNSDGTAEQPYVEIDYVDHTPPITTKTYGTPLVEDPTGAYPKWINSSTLITLTADDPDTTGYGCNSGVAETKYRVTLVNDKACWSAASGCSTYEGSGEWEDYDGSFTIDEESCHLIEYYSVDNVEKTEVLKKQCVFVDNTPPITTKTVGEPKILCDESPNSGEWCNLQDGVNDYWITQDTTITLNCLDTDQPHPVDNVILYWRDYLNEENPGEWNVEEQGYVEIQKDEDCLHKLEWYCVDALGNSEGSAENPILEYDNVDTEGPIVIRKYARVNGGKIIEGGIEGQEVEIAITSDDTIKLCAELEDIKQTKDIGVGIDEVFYELVGLPDPQLNWDETEEAYCIELEGYEISEYNEGDCGKWQFLVRGIDLLGNFGEWTNGLIIIIDNVPPMGEVLNPHAGNYYREEIPFQIYAPAVDFGGDYCSLCQYGYNEDCPASGVDYCDLYAIDYDFEGMDQDEIKSCYQDLWTYFQQVGANPNIVYLGRIPYEDGVCKGYVSIPSESGLTDTVFLGIDYVDKAGNQGNEIFGYHLQLALNPWLSPITMNIDNEGPMVYLTEDTNLPGPVTSGQSVHVGVEIVEYDSGFDDCWADIYTDNEGQLGEDTGLKIEGYAIDYNSCEINDEVPNDLESGDYLLKINARDEEFNVGSVITSMIVDNTRPTMSVVSPSQGEVYGNLLPISLNVEDSQSPLADETVKVRISEIPALGNVYCIFGTCEDSNWIVLTKQSNGLYADTIDLSEYGISGYGSRYVFNAVACDNLYVPELDTDLGFSLGNSRTNAHCRMISVHGMVEEESRTQCNDGIDNDLDGYIDLFDGSCSSSEDDDESANDCDLDEDGHLNVGCGGSDCNDNNPDSWRVGSFYVDMDFDGYHHFGEENYDPETDMLAICYGAEIPSGFSETTLGRDCDDSNGAVNPGATEICDNSIDDDCDGDVDYSDSDCPS